MKEEKTFSNYFSKDVINEILEWGKEESIHVYRVGKYGNPETSFYNYYDEVMLGLKIVRNTNKY